VRGSVTASAVVHLAALSVLFVLHPTRTVLLPGPDVVQVALIGEPEPAPPPAPVVKPTDTVVPDEQEGIQIQKVKPKPKPVVKQAPKRETPPQPQETSPANPQPEVPPNPAPTNAPRPQLSYAAVGEGLSGGIAADGNFEFAYYLQIVRAQIAKHWTPPEGATTGARTVVHFRVARSGAISALQLETGSGNTVFDQSAVRAIVITQQLPHLPLGYAGADLGIHLGFEYTGP